MTITVNDKPYQTGSDAILGFLQERGIESRLIVIELNGEIMRREEWAGVALRDGDVMQIAHMVAGG